MDEFAFQWHRKRIEHIAIMLCGSLFGGCGIATAAPRNFGASSGDRASRPLASHAESFVG